VTSDPLVGQTLGRYRLREPLAAGGQGQVYLADDLDLGRTVVVKVRPAAVAAQRAAATAEATAAAAIDHPYAIHVYASGLTDDGLAWTAMEWVRGPTLAELVARRGPLPPAEAVELIARLAEVVAALHGGGVIHRDVTPANVLVVTRAGAALPKLGDFGLVGAADDDGAGTPAYLAPELWRGADRRRRRSTSTRWPGAPTWR
jgi:serine/threonine protein kinase